MQTRSKSGIHNHRLHSSLFLTHFKPKTVKQALANADWLTAMRQDYDALLKNKSWDLVSLLPNGQAIGFKWVFRVKENADGSINRFKAQLVAKGFHQVHGFDFHETFSPMIKLITIQIIDTLALSHGWKLLQLDVNNAFLNGSLEETVFMTQPPGFEVTNKSLVCKLNKAIYGLKQAPRQWFDRLKSPLLQFGFIGSKSDSSLFIFRQQMHVVYLFVNVDDIILIGSSISLIQHITYKLNTAFSLKQLGHLDYFLGLEIKYLPNNSILMTQTKYIRDLLHKTNMAEAHSISSSMVSNCKLSRHGADASCSRCITVCYPY